MQIQSIFCDESCHLENDKQPIMLVGCVWTEKALVKQLHRQLDELKEKHRARGELKWQKVSQSRIDFFIEVINWFFSNPNLHFRCVVVSNKGKLNHNVFNKGSHDEFYYKLYYQLLHRVLMPSMSHEVYLDLKDTRGRLVLPMLRKVLCNAKRNFRGEMIRTIQNVHSNEIGLVQLADVLLGAVSYRNRNLRGNRAKLEIVELIESKFQRTLTQTSSLTESKFDVFVFHPREISTL